jgi:leader peptidase (prepilin peptidase) / N-methyltransferase
LLPPLAGALVGLCAGSFVGTLALRAPAGWRGMWWGRSRCPACGTTLAARDLVPLGSWLLAGGRCRHCGALLGAWYPLVELGAAAVGALSLGLLPAPEAWLAALLGWWLLALALIDLRSWFLPDALTLPLLAAGLLLAAWGEFGGLRRLPTGVTPAGSLAGAAAGYLALAGIGYAYRRWRGREGLGLGDAKLLAAAGAWLGAASLPWVVLLAAVAGLALAAARGGDLRAETPVPFGPSLALAFWCCFLALAWR